MNKFSIEDFYRWVDRLRVEEDNKEDILDLIKVAYIAGRITAPTFWYLIEQNSNE